jgi:hypothetical protein
MHKGGYALELYSMMEVQQFIIAILEAPDMSFETCSAPVT